jgi:hypothetical protein
MLVNSQRLLRVSFFLFLAFLVLVAISLPVLGQGTSPTPTPTPASSPSVTEEDTALAVPAPTGRGILNVRPPETLIDPLASPDPADSPDPTAGPDPAPPQGGGFGSAINSFGRARSQDRFVLKRNPRIAIPVWGSHLNAILNGFAFGAGFGAGLQLTTAESIPNVEFRFTALTSTKLYRLFEGEAYIPHFFGEKTHADFWFQYLRRTKDKFFGIGPRTPNTRQTNFDLEQRSVFAVIQHDFEPRLKAGVFAGIANTSTYPGQYDKDLTFAELGFTGNPNVIPRTLWAPGFQENTRIVSWGGYGEYDMRNDEHGLTRGYYLFLRVASHHGLDNNNAFSDFGWVEGTIDARVYIPIFSDRTSFAFRNQTVLQKTTSNNVIPFYDLAFLGGREYVRGFKDYRFRANNLLMFSAELRQTVYAIKEDRGIDVVGFGDAGQVWGDNRSQILEDLNGFDSRNWRAGIGGGLQYRHSKGLAGRVELGHSNERNLIYFSLTRGF